MNKGHVNICLLFWLTATEYPFGVFSDLELLDTPLVSFLTYSYWIPLWFLFWLTELYWIPIWFLFWLTATEYPSGFFSDLRLLNTPLVSFLTYSYWIPLWFLFWLTATEYPFGFFSDLQLLNTPLVSFLTYSYWSVSQKRNQRGIQ
jgi:hypothetical protein